MVLSGSILILFSILYIVLSIFGQDINIHSYFVAIFLLILTIIIFFFSITNQNLILRAGTFIMMIAGTLDIVSLALHGYIATLISHNILDIIFVALYAIGLFQVITGMYLVILKQTKQHALLSFFDYYNNAIYFSIDYNKNKVDVDLLKEFQKKHFIEYGRLSGDLEDFLGYIHPEDVEMVKKHFERLLTNVEEKAMKYRIKFPEMKDYCWIFSKGIQVSANVIYGVNVDISTTQKMTEELSIRDKRIASFEDEQTRYKEEMESISREMKHFEKEMSHIMKNTTDLISEIALDGTILYASPSFANAYEIPMNKLIGKNIKDINKTVGVIDNPWIEEAIKNKTSQSFNKIEANGRAKWLSWKNDIVFDQEGKPEYIITIGHDVTKLVTLSHQLQKENTHDALTGLLNRRGLFQEIEQLDTKGQYACFYIDIDNLVSINDYYGHHVGDALLKEFANGLKEWTDNDCLVARMAGDEFLIICKGVYSYEELDQIKNLLSSKLHAVYQANGVEILLKSKVGFALYPEDANNFEKLVTYASLAMINNKNNINDVVFRFEEGMVEDLNERITLSNSINQAIDSDIIEVFFHPIVDVTNNQFVYVEALARWYDKEFGYIAPGTFLKIAQESGQIIELDLFLINKALRYFLRLSKTQNYQETILSINVSPATLMLHNFVLILNNLVDQKGLPREKVCLEISENTFVNNITFYTERIEELKKAGYIIALDDFGREFSSLAVLDNIHFDIIKIDKIFVDKIERIRNIEIIKMILRIASISDKKVIAEGVETRQQKEDLLALGCTLQQGYFFVKPEKMI